MSQELEKILFYFQHARGSVGDNLRLVGSILHYVVANNRLDYAKILIDQGIDINCEIPYIYYSHYNYYDSREEKFGGCTPLHIAVIYGHVEIVDWLLKSGANINAQNQKRATPLHVIVNQIITTDQHKVKIRKRYTKIINLLIISGADVNLRDDIECTPLHYAVSVSSEKLSKLLIEAGADVNIANSQNTLLNIAIERDRNEIAQLLISNGAIINTNNENSPSPLHLSIKKISYGMVRLLLENGADPNQKNKYYEAPLHMAVKLKNLSIIKSLVKYGKNIDLNVQSDERGTPLNSAVLENNFEIFQYLVTVGAQMDLRHGSMQMLMRSKEKEFNVYSAISIDSRIMKSVDKFKRIKESWDIWEMDEETYEFYLQWLPQEVNEDVMEFLLLSIKNEC